MRARAVRLSSALCESTSVAARTRSATPTSSTCRTLHAREVAEGLGRGQLVVGQRDQHRTAAVGVQQLGGLRRARRVAEAGGVDDVDRPALGVHRQRGAQRGATSLAVDLEDVVTRARAEDRAAARPDRRAAGAGACAAGALLAPRLRAAAGDHAAGLGRVRALAARGQLGHDDLVHERAVERLLEDVGVEVDGGAATQCGGLRHRYAPPRCRPWNRGRSRGPSSDCGRA